MNFRLQKNLYGKKDPGTNRKASSLVYSCLVLTLNLANRSKTYFGQSRARLQYYL